MIDFACVSSTTPTWSNDPRWYTPGIVATEAEQAALQRVTSQPPAGGACCAEEAPGDREGFWLGRMRLSRVGVVGVVVGVMWKDAYVRFEIDDGSGVVPGAVWFPACDAGGGARQHDGFPMSDGQRQMLSHQTEQQVERAQAREALQLGNTVRMHGRLNRWDGGLEVVASSVQLERDPNTEAFHWCQVIFLWRQCMRSWAEGAQQVQEHMRQAEACQPAAEQMPLQSVAWEAIQSRLADSRGCFRMADFMRDAQLCGEAAGSVGEDAERALRRALLQLRDAGQVFQSCPTTDTFSIRVAEDLVAPAVLQCLRQAGPAAPLSMAALRARLPAADPRAKHASNDPLSVAVDLLVQRSAIYESQPDCYQLLM
eukprot:jgi/Tetstr1/422126/TSEL_012982.t1